MADSSHSAVDSLLGRLSSVLLDEAQLLSRVHGDVLFIKEEMESMNGLLLDVADAGRPNNQVRAWTRQVQGLAYDSQNCIDRYVQTFGASRPSAGLLGSLRRVRQVVRTMPGRHRIATQIRELKARAREAGERRQRYGVTAPRTADGELRKAIGGGDVATTKTKLQQEEEDARRRLVLADAAGLWDVDASAREVMAWLIRRGRDGDGDGHRPASTSVAKFLNNMFAAKSKTEELLPELIKLVRELLGDDHPHNIAEAVAVLKDTGKETAKGETQALGGWLKDTILGKSAADHDSSPQEDDKKEKPAAVDVDALEMVKKASNPLEVAKAEMLYVGQLIKWLRQVFGDDFFQELVFGHGHRRRPRILAIVTPPVDVRNPEEDEPHTHKRATELARAVYNHSREAGHFDCTAWIDAKLHPQRKQRLQCLLQEVLLHQGLHDDRDQMSTWDEARLKQEIQEHLKGKSFLIVLADHEDDSPWAHITPALPADYSVDSSTIIVTPFIQQTTQFHGWYIASWFFLRTAARYKVHFYSHLDAVRKKAAELLVGSDHIEDSQAIMNEILKKCRWDSFSTKMVLHALYANPDRSKEELERLLLSLSDFSTVTNAMHIIRFCYDDLPSHHKDCLLYVSIFPQDFKVRRTSLVRRWAAENLITKTDGLSATDEAQRCFNALTARGLLLPAGDIGPAGKVKSCTVHPHVFSFITKMASKGNNVGNTDLLPPDLAHRLPIRDGIQRQRLSKKLQAAHSNTSCWRRATPKNSEGSGDSSLHDMVTILKLLPGSSRFGLVKVLDLEGFKGFKKRHLKNICSEIFQLKYLSLRNTDVTDLPKEIDKLRYLETFDIRQTKIQSFPAKAIVLPKLVHLLAGHKDATGSDESFSTVHMPRGIGNMTNMQTLSHVEVSRGSDGEHELESVSRLQQLRRLGVVIHGDKEDHSLTRLIRAVGMLGECLRSLSVCIELAKVDGQASADMNKENITSPPNSLESLNITGRISGLPTWIKELHQLSKITLCRTHLMTDSAIQILGELVNLRCIRLRQESYIQKKLTLEKKRFKKLEFLVIEGSDISDVQFDQNAAPKLRKIVWTSTCKMETLSGVENLPSLKEIVLNGDCDLRRIRQSMEANPNHPILKGTAAAASHVSPN